MGHHFDNLPVLSEELCGVVNIGRLHFNGASSPPAAVRYLKMEGVVCRLRVYMNRLMIAAHSVSPCIASNWDTLDLQIGFSCGLIVAGRRSEYEDGQLTRLALSGRSLRNNLRWRLHRETACGRQGLPSSPERNIAPDLPIIDDFENHSDLISRD